MLCRSILCRQGLQRSWSWLWMIMITDVHCGLYWLSVSCKKKKWKSINIWWSYEIWWVKQSVHFLRATAYMLSAHMLSQFRPSVCLSVRPSHGWISQKRLKLGSCNFHHTVAHPSSFCTLSFIRKFWRLPSERGHQQGWGRKNSQFSANNSPYLRNGAK